MNKKLRLTLIASSVFLSLSSQQALATNGYAAHGFGLMQKAMGGTAVAGHDNAMNIATNPASMSFGQNNWTAGIDIFVPDRGVNYAGTPAAPPFPAGTVIGQNPDGSAALLNFPFSPTGGLPATPALQGADLRGNDDGNFPIPEFAYQKHLNDKFAVGVAVYGNGGMNATYNRSIFGSRDPLTGATTGPNTGIDFSQLFFAPSVSMKVNENHAIGASLNLVYQRIRVDGVGGFGVFSRDRTNLSDNGYDNSTGAGVSLGWQGKVTPKVTAGLAYRSKTAMSKFDKYAGLLAEQGDFDIPSMITAGVSIQATSRTTIALDLARINYTDVKSISNKNNTAPLQGQLLQGVNPFAGVPFQGALLGDNDGAGFGWEDQNVIKIGIKHQLNNKITLMGGWNHGKAPIGEDQTAFNILAPATVEDHLTLGLDWKLTPKSNVTFSYMHAFENEITGDGSRNAGGGFNSPGAIINNGPNPLSNATSANVDMHQDSFGVAYTRNF